MYLGDIFLILQGVCTVLAVLFNTFLIHVILRYSKQTVGKYKWLLTIFASFEMVYAVVVFFGMPVNFIADKSWLVFNHGGFIGGTEFAVLGPTLYCSFYELWIGLVVVHFVYRYIALCRLDWKHHIIYRFDIKLFLFFLYCCHFAYCFVCGIYFCTRSEMSPKLFQQIRDQFDVKQGEHIGYILLRTKNLDGTFSYGGFASIMNHYILVVTSVCIIFFTGSRIWMEILRMQRACVNLKDVRIQRQIFVTLLIQSIVPIFLCHLPSIFYLTFPFFSFDVELGSVSAIFSLLTAVPKALDPIIIICGIRDYKHAAKNILGGRNRIRVTTVSGLLAASSQIASQVASQPSNH